MPATMRANSSEKPSSRKARSSPRPGTQPTVAATGSPRMAGPAKPASRSAGRNAAASSRPAAALKRTPSLTAGRARTNGTATAAGMSQEGRLMCWSGAGSKAAAPRVDELDEALVRVRPVPGSDLETVDEHARRASEAERHDGRVGRFTDEAQVFALLQAGGHTGGFEAGLGSERHEVRAGFRKRLPGLHAFEHDPAEPEKRVR